MSELLLDRAGRRRSPATLPGFHADHAPGNKGLRYPADPPKVEEIIAVMRTAGDAAHGRRLRGLIVIMWRARLRIQEALALAEGDLAHRRGSLLVRSAVVRHQRRDVRSPLVARCARAELRRTAAAAGVRRRFAPHQLRHAHRCGRGPYLARACYAGSPSMMWRSNAPGVLAMKRRPARCMSSAYSSIVRS